jgi:hypothetical protein
MYTHERRPRRIENRLLGLRSYTSRGKFARLLAEDLRFVSEHVLVLAEGAEMAAWMVVNRHLVANN